MVSAIEAINQKKFGTKTEAVQALDRLAINCPVNHFNSLCAAKMQIGKYRTVPTESIAMDWTLTHPLVKRSLDWINLQVQSDLLVFTASHCENTFFNSPGEDIFKTSVHLSLNSDGCLYPLLLSAYLTE